VNDIRPKEKDPMFIRDSKCIDSVMASEGILEHIKGCRLVDYNEILLTEYRKYLFDINIQEYFKSKSFNINKIYSSKLNSKWQSHMNKFTEKVDKLIELTNLQEMIDNYYNRYATDEILEQIDMF